MACACALLCNLPLTAAADGNLAKWPSQGLAPDAQLVGGAGFGFGRALHNPFLGRARLGALYAHLPLIANAGVTFEAGALGRLAIGGELELNSWNGLFGDLGVSRTEGSLWLSHVALGYTVFALEWQHMWSAQVRPSHALLFEVRLPLGMWWFMLRRKDAESRPARSNASAPAAAASSAAVGGEQPAESQAPASSAGVARPRAPVPRSPNDASMPASRQNAAMPASRQNAAMPASPKDAADIDALLAQASQAPPERAAPLLAEAYARRPDAAIVLQLSAAEAAQGRLVLAAHELRHFLASVHTPDALQHQPELNAQLEQLEQRCARLRLTLSGAHGDEQVLIDGKPEPSATLGYDVLLDPGEHTVAVVRSGTLLIEQRVNPREHELVRLPIALPP